jgi:putative ABC transport system permease protein
MVVPREDGTPEQVGYGVVTTNFFDVVGGKIRLGRDFTALDGVPQPKAPGNDADAAAAPGRLPTIAILSYEYFRRRYGGNSAAIGRNMTIPGQPGPLIAGVLAPGFRLYFPPDADVEPAPDIWFANRLDYDSAIAKNFLFVPSPDSKREPHSKARKAQPTALPPRRGRIFPSTRLPVITSAWSRCKSTWWRRCVLPYWR